MNLYPERDELGTGKDGEVASLISTPGLGLLATIGNGPIRGIYYSTAQLSGGTNTGIFYVVSGNTLYSVNSSWVATSVGTLLTNSGPVSMADNKIQLFVVDGPNGYWSTLGSTSLTQVTDPNFSGSNTITFQDGYFIFNTPYSDEFYLSDLNAVTFTAPATSSKEGYPDNIVGCISANRNLWLIGDQTVEVWFDSGNNLNPFEYIQGTLGQVGCTSPYSVTKIANTVAWLGKDDTGAGIVFMANGYTPQRISTHAVELAIESYDVIDDAIGFAYEENGHLFYFLTFPTANATWVYDVITKMWHERGYLISGQFTRHRANCFAFVFDTTLVVGDYQNGNIYEMSSSIYSDNGNPLVRQRVTPHVSKDMNRIVCSELQLDIETGVGLDGIGQGTNPQAMLQWSNDGGHTWSNEHWSMFGPIGATKSRAIWRRLGQSRNRVYKVSISDPVKVVIMGAEIDLQVNAS